MANQHSQLDFNSVELTQDINVHTSLPPSCHSALRAGFAGYTDNPRWTPQKRRAWKQGKQWRSDLAANVIHVENGLLMTQEAQKFAPGAIASEQEPSTSPSKGNVFQQLLGWPRKKPAINCNTPGKLDPSAT